MPHQPGCLFHEFSKQATLDINRLAKSNGANLNVWLLTQTYLTFKPTESDIDSNRPFRLTIPVSLRKAQHRKVPAANMVSLVCMDRNILDIENTNQLIESINRQIQVFRKQQQVLLLPISIRFLKKYPNKVRAAMRRKQFSGTTLLSNLGPAFASSCLLPKNDGKVKIGDHLQIETVEFLSALRYGQSFTLAVNVYAGHLVIGMHYDPRLLTETEAQQLFEKYLDNVRGAAPSGEIDH